MVQLKRLVDASYRKLAVRSPNVSAHSSVHIGPFTRVWSAHGLVIEQEVYIGKFCTIEVDGRIGAGSLIANSVGLVGREDHDFATVGVPIRHAAWVGARSQNSTDVLDIGRDCWIGYGSVVLSGLTIGDFSVVAAGSVVHASIPANSIVGGNPARVLRARFSPEDLARHETLTSDILT